MDDFLFSNTKIANYFEGIFMHYPGLFITKEHPRFLSEESVYLHFPFTVLEATYSSTNELLADIVLLSKENNHSIIKIITKKYKMIKRVGVSLNLGVISFNFEI